MANWETLKIELARVKDELYGAAQKLASSRTKLTSIQRRTTDLVDELEQRFEDEREKRIDLDNDLRDYLTERDETLNRQFADSSDEEIRVEQVRVRELLEALK